MTSLEELWELLSTGRDRDALALVERALQSASSGDTLESMAAALWDRADTIATSDGHVAEAMYRAVIGLQHKAHGEPSEEEFVGWWSLAAFLERRGETHAARDAYRSMIAVAEKLVEADPALLERALSRYANLLHSQGEWIESEELLRRVITSLKTDWPGREDRERRFGKKGPSIVEVLGSLRRNLVSQGRLDEANEIERRIEEIRPPEDNGG